MPNQLYIYGDIGESFWDDSGITDDKIRKELDAFPRDESLQVHINTLGGQTHHGIAIYNILASYKEKQRALNSKFELETINDGFAYSAGSIIFLAGDKRTMNLGSRLMIHNPWSMMMGDHREALKLADYLKKAKDSVLSMYAAISGKDEKTFDKLMDDETYFMPQEAVDIGLATQHTDKKGESSKSNPYEKTLASFDLALKHSKSYVTAMYAGRKRDKQKQEKSSQFVPKFDLDMLQRELTYDTLCI